MTRSNDETKVRVEVIRDRSTTQLGRSAVSSGVVRPVGPLVRSLLAWDLVEQVSPWGMGAGPIRADTTRHVFRIWGQGPSLTATSDVTERAGNPL
jgi:hypothetical protein